MNMSKWMVGLLLSQLAVCAQAAEWPVKATKVIVPYGPGGGVDTFTRPVAARLQEQLGHPFIVDNRAGAGGTIGVAAAAKSPADGSTLLAGGVHQPMAESLYKDKGYDLDKDLAALGVIAVVPNVLLVLPKAPWKTVSELIAHAQANPGKLNYCSSGIGTSQHIVAEMFMMQTKTKMLHVPHKGTAAALVTFLAGQCDLMFDGMGTAAGQIKGSKLRPLAVTTAERSELFPTIPTMKEAGGPAMDVGTWYAMWTTAGTPKDVQQKMRAEIDKALTSPSVKETWKAQGAALRNIPLDRMQSFVREEVSLWTQVNQQAGIKLD
ncbi:MAG: hypothetical protein JWP36_41 [Paucimonas sp.]|nr:hypothetical protein [Paucimonas sp.]